MASEEHTEDTSAADEQSNGSASNGHNLGRVAAIAAATGATAFAAHKALGSRSSSSQNDEDEDEDDESVPKKKSSSSAGGSASLVTAAVSSGWDVAKDSLVPVIEDAATKAGAFVADRAPEVVRDVVVPRFIAGFERAQRGSSDD